MRLVNAGSASVQKRPSDSPVMITTEWGAATPQIFQALAANEVLKTVLIEFVRTGPTGVQELYHTIRLSKATVSSDHMDLRYSRVAAQSIDSGGARAKLDQLIAFTRT